MAKIQKLTDEIIAKNNKLYQDYEKLSMDNGWLAGNQQENFEIMLKIANYCTTDFTGKSCLDVGCGTGDFSKILRERGISNYLGIDIYQPALKKARQKYPHESFLFADIVKNELTEKFDFVFCSGALSMTMPFDNYEYLAAMLETMWQLTKLGLAFNMITNEDDGRFDPDIFPYDPKKVLAVCKKVAPNANLKIEPTPGKAQIHVFMWR